MTALPFERDLRTLREIVEELRGEGWTVVAEPRGEALPEPLRNLQVDLIARRGGQTLIVEIASRDTAKKEKIDLLAERVGEVPNARFEVYWQGDTPEEKVSAGDVEAYASEAMRVAVVSPGGALLIAWAAMERAIVLFNESRLFLKDWGLPWQLLNQMYSLGHVSEVDFKRLSALWHMRNQYAHQSRRVQPSQGDIEYLVHIATAMAHGNYVSSDQMVEWFSDVYENELRRDEREVDQPLSKSRERIRQILQSTFSTASPESIDEAVRALEVPAA